MLELQKAFKLVCCVFCVLTIASVVCASKQLNEVNVIVIASTPECYPGNPLLTVLRFDDLNYRVLCIILSLIQLLCDIYFFFS